MILVFGGTTEGKQVASILDDLQLPYYYSTKTKIDFNGMGKPISGAMDVLDIERFCIENKVSHIINASHPFAEELHKTIANNSLSIPLIRFERFFPEKTNHELVHYVDGFKEAIQLLKNNKYKKLLALSGVQTIQKLTSFWKQNKTWFRILDRESSRAIAQKSGFPSENLLFGYPQSSHEEVLLYKELNPDVILTKESGTNGKLEQKITAAITTNTSIVIINKPLLSKKYICVNNETQLITILKEAILE
ncbi:hypothetical protein A8C32_08195 [Flavivirga aquatica]|uniref:Precorrin-6x reductase n=1 Tax=Flavivirga aquatica TaxID=1849968 RepID=A0A1E5SJZ0_9FLAO|nr:precorrin-6A/cobalt-precorrin-6A reductase [Flavivirga aquatica]OEJ99430.1 hypothetical protein A8C32_08195 [Flavivirga aquatica]